jgi:hypothetical protein
MAIEQQDLIFEELCADSGMHSVFVAERSSELWHIEMRYLHYCFLMRLTVDPLTPILIR